jgi:hypothetical protein
VRRDAEPRPATRAPRPYLGIRFRCCNAYRRIYLNRDGSAFFGHCPKCLRPVRIAVGEQGSAATFWEVE